MPILHQYQDRSGWFVRTRIGDSIVTFQLTLAGAKRLIEAGLSDGSRFRRALLFALYRTGDAYTGGSGPGVIEPYRKDQLDIDFSDDPEPESIFPRCSFCGSFADLHMVEIGEKSKRHIMLSCSSCRKKRGASIDTSIPLPLVTRAIFTKVLELKRINDLDKSATIFKESLDRAFNEKWDDLARKKIKRSEIIQEMLIPIEEKQRKLPRVK